MQGDVTVRVTPKELSGDATSWSFEISLDTHSVALDQDLKKIAKLIDNQGQSRRPTSWTGDSSGGHHTAGILSFEPLPTAQEITLELGNIAGSKRIFTWQL